MTAAGALPGLGRAAAARATAAPEAAAAVEAGSTVAIPASLRAGRASPANRRAAETAAAAAGSSAISRQKASFGRPFEFSIPLESRPRGDPPLFRAVLPRGGDLLHHRSLDASVDPQSAAA